MAHQYESSDGRDGMPVLRFGSCIRVPRWALAELLDHRPCRAAGRWTAGLTSRTAAAAVAVTVGAAAADVRRAVGPTAWCALEVLAATPADDGELWIVRSSVRDVAARLGVAPNTAQRALAVLREAGLVTAIQGREHGGRFGATAYRLTVDPSVLCRQTREPLVASSPMLAPQPRVAAKPAVDLGQQLVLLPSA